MRTEREHVSARAPGSWDAGLRDRPIGELVGDLVEETQGILRDEIRIAKSELREEARKAARAGAGFGAGGVLLHAALLAGAAAILAAFALVVPVWAAALITMGIFGFVGLVALAYGRAELQRLEPARPVDRLKEEGEWAKRTMRSVRSSRDANA